MRVTNHRPHIIGHRGAALSAPENTLAGFCMAAALEEVLPKLPADVKVIPGHGPVSNLDDVRKFVAMLKETRAVVAKGVAAHKTLEQLQKEKVLAAWEKWSGDFVKTDVWIETIDNELTGEKGSGLRQHN